MKRLIIPIPLGGGMDPSTRYGASLSMTMDEDYVLTISLLDQNNEILSTQSVDTPLESVVVDGRYDAQTQSLVLVLDNGNEISIPVSGLIANMRSTYDLADMTQSDLVDFYTNYATLITQNNYVLNGYPFSIGTMEQQGVTLLVLEYNSVFGSNATDPTVPTDAISVSQKTYLLLPNGTLQDYSANGMIVPTINYLSTVAHTGDYNDLRNKPEGGNTIYTSEEEYDALTVKEDADYQLRNKIDYEKDVVNKPLIEGVYASKNITEKKLDELELGVGGVQRHVFLTQAEYDLLPAKEEGVIYVIEGQTLEMVVTFQDQSTATYNVVID